MVDSRSLLAAPETGTKVASFRGFLLSNDVCVALFADTVTTPFAVMEDPGIARNACLSSNVLYRVHTIIVLSPSGKACRIKTDEDRCYVTDFAPTAFASFVHQAIQFRNQFARVPYVSVRFFVPPSSPLAHATTADPVPAFLQPSSPTAPYPAAGRLDEWGELISDDLIGKQVRKCPTGRRYHFHCTVAVPHSNDIFDRYYRYRTLANEVDEHPQGQFHAWRPAQWKDATLGPDLSFSSTASDGYAEEVHLLSQIPLHSWSMATRDCDQYPDGMPITVEQVDKILIIATEPPQLEVEAWCGRTIIRLRNDVFSFFLDSDPAIDAHASLLPLTEADGELPPALDGALELLRQHKRTCFRLHLFQQHQATITSLGTGGASAQGSTKSSLPLPTEAMRQFHVDNMTFEALVRTGERQELRLLHVRTPARVSVTWDVPSGQVTGRLPDSQTLTFPMNWFLTKEGLFADASQPHYHTLYPLVKRLLVVGRAVVAGHNPEAEFKLEQQRRVQVLRDAQATLRQSQRMRAMHSIWTSLPTPTETSPSATRETASAELLSLAERVRVALACSQRTREQNGLARLGSEASSATAVLVDKKDVKEKDKDKEKKEEKEGRDAGEESLCVDTVILR